MKPVLVTSGEPAGIGPDICLALAAHEWPLVILGDKTVLETRAKELNLEVRLIDYDKQGLSVAPGTLSVLSIPCAKKVSAGILAPENAAYVIEMLSIAVEQCLQGRFSALVTAPVNKAVINQSGYDFTGHTEFLAQKSQVKSVVMMLACNEMKVALTTTHLPLREVPDALTKERLATVINVLYRALKNDFARPAPVIYIAGLNPHAGEGGYLGREEIEIITPVIEDFKAQGVNLIGPLPADTLFSSANLNKADAFLAMYHDQGLPVLKYAGFGEAVNITLGLPFIRTSVDHGTALSLAGTGLAKTTSLLSAVSHAVQLAKIRGHFEHN